VAEEDFPVLRHAGEERLVRQGGFPNAAAQEAPEAVVVPGHAQLSRFVGRPEGFLVEQAGFLPEGALSGEDADG
jgi:hypothetical protein